MTRKLRVFEAFSGIGSQRKALFNIGVPHEVIAISEIDKYAIKSYIAIHGEVNNLGDITKIDVNDIPEHDLFTYSFPCQDISSAGKRCGFTKGSNTRSSLLWECQRIIEHCKPKYLLMENVKNLVSKRFKCDFDMWLEYLESLGYTNYYKVLNAKDFGIPQNRERVFVVSVLGGCEFEFITPNIHSNLSNFVSNDIYEQIDSRIMKSCIHPFTMEYENIIISDKDIYQCKVTSGYQDKKVGIKVSPTLRANKTHTCVLIDGKIKKLTSKDMWMLSGFDELDYQKAKSVVSDAQLMKQAGNTIVVQVLESIFKQLFIK